MTQRAEPIAILPPGLAPRGLSREQAAAYIGVSATLFDQMVGDRRMPQPRLINRRRVWDRVELDLAFAALPHVAEPDLAAADVEADVWSKAAV